MTATESWTVLSAVASSLSAIGTTAAVIVALYLSRREKSVRLLIQEDCGVVGSWKHDPPIEFVINIINAGYLTTTITRVVWRVGGRFAGYEIVPQRTPICEAWLPVKLAHGESFSFRADVKDIEISLPDLLLALRTSKQGRFRKIHIGAETSLGRSFFCALDYNLQYHIERTADKA